MTIFNVGSINWDRVLRVPRFPAPGETLSAVSVSTGLGGKGLNQSVAISAAQGSVVHVGAVGAGDEKVLRMIAASGVDCGAIAEVDGVETGSATILVDASGENLIVLDVGANAHLSDGAVAAALAGAGAGDWLLFQNETNQARFCAAEARRRGLKVAFSAAPFVAGTVAELLDHVDLLSVNEVELRQLEDAVGGADRLPAGVDLLVTRGAQGAEYRAAGGQVVSVAAHDVTPVDTTGAGDTFLGYFLAALDAGDDVRAALELAGAAAALQIGRAGAAAAIPTRAEVARFLDAAARAV
ncbi:ribokinase [Rhodobacteraceae bacterium 2CG4]|uniref:Ribokinase n=1 Tax=Halovulum marinum TaxID=2662447 RepID=A0A6L5YZJ6_9RHOB|nr:PfkB family carbohydrate kinase [Halovulum marinum]MSU89330.1 ribokinase [Halovulum marinum]